MISRAWQVIQKNIPYPYTASVDKFLLVDQHFHVHVNGSMTTSLMIALLPLQQCSACLVRLILMVLEMGSKWSYIDASWDVASMICSI